MYHCTLCGYSHPSYQAYHRHKTIKHPETISSKSDRINLYEANPNTCKTCSIPLPYHKRKQQFCSSSCSAKNANATRDQEASNSKVVTTWRSKLGVLHRDDPNYKPNNRLYIPTHKPEVICPTCSKPYIQQTKRQIFCSLMCNTTRSAKVRYREACSFNLNPTDHYTLYDFVLIKQVGWYTPANKGTYNPNGVTWDHLYRIEEGFKNKVPPHIMSHPANAEMIPWIENKARKTSQITLEELYNRIKCWNNPLQ